MIDVGSSLNPALDIGQIEGGFIQGYGYFVTEELLYSDTGQLVTDSAGKYKVPTIATVPKNFRVALLKGHPNQNQINVFSSKVKAVKNNRNNF